MTALKVGDIVRYCNKPDGANYIIVRESIDGVVHIVNAHILVDTYSNRLRLQHGYSELVYLLKRVGHNADYAQRIRRERALRALTE